MPCQVRRFFLKKDSASLEPAEQIYSFWSLLGVLLRSLIGVAVFSLHGEIVKTITGPAILLSYVMAAVTMLLAGLNLAEFASHSERSGSIYQQTYLLMGELWAVLVGWLMFGACCLESAIIAKIFSGYTDALTRYQIRKKMKMLIGADLLAVGTIVIITTILLLNFRKTLMLKTKAAVGTIIVCLHFMLSRLNSLNLKYWDITFESLQDVDQDAGEGGFSPYLSLSVVRGAAYCVCSFAGISVLSTTVAKTKSVKTMTILTLTLSTVINLFLLIGTAAVLTLMAPYYKQEDVAVFSYALRALPISQIILEVAVMLVTLFRLVVVLRHSAMLITAMADDGLVFAVMARKDETEDCPALAFIVASVLATLMCVFLHIFDLFITMSLVLLLTYTLVAVFTIKLRYKHVAPEEDSIRGLPAAIMRRLLNDEVSLRRLSSRVVSLTTLFYLIWCVLFSVIVFFFYDDIVERNTVGIFLILLAIVFLIISFVLMQMNPQTTELTDFRLRLSPLCPCLSVLLNVLLMAFFGWAIWTAVALWLVVGLIIYFGYGMRHSKLVVDG